MYATKQTLMAGMCALFCGYLLRADGLPLTREETRDWCEHALTCEPDMQGGPDMFMTTLDRVRKGEIDTNTLVSVVCEWVSVTNGSCSAEKFLANQSLSMLGFFPSEASKKAIVAAISNNSTKVSALYSLVQIAEGASVGPEIGGVIDNRIRFTEEDRYNVYTAYINRVKSMSSDSNKLQQAISTMVRWFEGDLCDGNRFLLDRYLGVVSPSYRVSQLRRDWLTMLKNSSVVLYKSYALQMVDTNCPTVFVEPIPVLEME